MRPRLLVAAIALLALGCLPGIAQVPSPTPQPSPAGGFSSSRAPKKTTTPDTPPHTSTPEYCDQELGFCLTIPRGWKVLGDVYEGMGVSFAPPQAGDESLWTQVTVAVTEIPLKEGQDPPTIENLVTTLIGRMAESTGDLQTVRRMDTSLAGNPAQLVEVNYTQGEHRWAEIVVVVDAEGGDFDSVVFKSLVEQRDTHEHAFSEMLRSFRLTE